CARPRGLAAGLLLAEIADTIEMSLGPDERRTVSYCVGSQCALAEGIASQLLKHFPWRQHHTCALLILQINSSVRPNWRCRVIPAHTLSPVDSSGLCIDTGCDAGIGDEVEFVTSQQQRGCLGRSFSELPHHMSASDIALPVG